MSRAGITITGLFAIVALAVGLLVYVARLDVEGRGGEQKPRGRGGGGEPIQTPKSGTEQRFAKPNDPTNPKGQRVIVLIGDEKDDDTCVLGRLDATGAFTPDPDEKPFRLSKRGPSGHLRVIARADIREFLQPVEVKEK